MFFKKIRRSIKLFFGPVRTKTRLLTQYFLVRYLFLFHMTYLSCTRVAIFWLSPKLCIILYYCIYIILQQINSELSTSSRRLASNSNPWNNLRGNSAFSTGRRRNLKSKWFNSFPNFSEVLFYDRMEYRPDKLHSNSFSFGESLRISTLMSILKVHNDPTQGDFTRGMERVWPRSKTVNVGHERSATSREKYSGRPFDRMLEICYVCDWL